MRSWRGELARLGLRPRWADFAGRPGLRPALEGAAGLVLLGGSANVEDAPRRPHLAREMELVRRAAARGLPVLGICLGGQLAAAALGGRVFRSPRPEIGWRRLRWRGNDSLAAHAPERVFQWHQYAFEPPPAALSIASSRACRHQAFRLGRTLGVQFHFEVDRPTIDSWAASERLMPRESLAIAKDSARHLGASRRFGRRIWAEFAGLVRAR